METSITSGHSLDVDYHAYLESLQARFEAVVADGRPIFTTDAKDLFQDFLSGFRDLELRKHYNCRSCMHFIERFGGLVFINGEGAAKSIMWDHLDAPDFLKEGIKRMENTVNQAKVTGVFLSSEATYGTPCNVSKKTGETWKHLAIVPTAACRYRNPINTAEQQMAEKLQDYETVQTALNEFTPEAVDLAITLLESDALYRSEKCLGVARWLKTLYEIRNGKKHNKQQRNLMWREIATAPSGFCHPRSSMIGSLLEDIMSGMDFAVVSKRFADKMHPLQYARPQAAPTAGNIAQAEKVIEALKAAGSLARRYARLEDIQTLWKPKIEQEKSSGGVFGHLKPKEAKPTIQSMTMPSKKITWEKFEREVLPLAEEILFNVPGSKYNPFSCLLTAVNPEAAPILQWDFDDNRNPVSWYFKMGGFSPSEFNLTGYSKVKVTAVALKPTMWHPTIKFEHQGNGVFFILEGAKPINETAGLCLFPEILKSDFHGIRSTIEAFSAKGKLEGLAEATACGVQFHNQAQDWNATFDVKIAGVTHIYLLDRWN